MIRKIASEFVPLRTAAWIAVVVVASILMAMFSQRTPLVSPELHKDSSVTFRLERSGAHEALVALAGLESPRKLTQAQGVWWVTSAPLTSGAYWYSYIVNGRAQPDPLNSDVVPNYAYLNSVVRVPGPVSAPWERADVPQVRCFGTSMNRKL